MAQKTLTKIAVGILSLVAFFLAHGAFAASLSLSPSIVNVSAGQSFTVRVLASSPDQAMNAVQGTLAFPVGLLSVVSVSKANSIINLWVQEPSFSNQDGVVNFQGVVVNPGFQGNAGDIIDVVFDAKATGQAALSFSSGSILANDGQGTNILSTLTGGGATISPPSPGTSSIGQQGVEFHPLITTVPPITSGQWYNLNAITFEWALPSSASAVNYALSSNPDYQLPVSEQPLISSTTYDLSSTPDGTWYFFLSFREPTGWTPVAILPLLLDRTPPAPFAIIRVDTDLSDPQPVFTWSAVDDASGIDHYLVKIGNGNWFDASTILRDSHYVLPPQSRTNGREITVRAYDKAGNYTEESTTFVVTATGISAIPLMTLMWYILLAILVIGILIYIFRWQRNIKGELTIFRAQMQRDLQILEGQLKTGGQESLEQDVKKLESNVEENIGKIDKKF